MRKYKIGDMVTFTQASSESYDHLIDTSKKHRIIGIREEHDAGGKVRQIMSLHSSRYEWAETHFMPVRIVKKRNLPDWF